MTNSEGKYQFHDISFSSVAVSGYYQLQVCKDFDESSHILIFLCSLLLMVWGQR